jgi:hypothetical protein
MIAGNVSDPGIANVTVAVNGVNTSIPVMGFNFSTVTNVTTPATLVVSAFGTAPLTVLLDGDYLPGDFEQDIGFDPLDPDSDCTSTPGNEADNETIDGYEVFDGRLPVFVKYRIGGNPFIEDTDSDGLDDDVEVGALLEFGGVQSYQMLSDPTNADGDGDGLEDPEKLGFGTNPNFWDTDNDWLSDSTDPDPLRYRPRGLSPEEKADARALAVGSVFGESGLPGGSFSWLVGEDVASSPYYLIGWVSFSCAPAVGTIADVRDTVQAVINRDSWEPP